MPDKSPYLGALEELVLLAILGLGDEAYGAKIYLELDKAGRRMSIGSLYVTLGRLEEKGYVRSWEGEATPERGGRAKKYFAVRGAGKAVLQESQETRQKLRSDTELRGGMTWA